MSRDCHENVTSLKFIKFIKHLLREALLTLEGGVKLVFPSVRACVREDNNCFLRRVYEPTTHAGSHWQFEIIILKVFKKTSQKVKLSLKVGTLGDPFWSHFGGTFLAKCFKNATFG